MKKTTKQLFSALLAFSLVLGAVPGTVSAASDEGAQTETQTQSVPEISAEVSARTPVLRQEAVEELSFDLSGFHFHENLAQSLLKADQVVIDEDSAEIRAMSDSLDQITVYSEEQQQSVPLTEEQKQQVLGMFQEYLKFWKENAPVLGVQLPFFLNYNDEEDELGILGQMIAMDPAHNMDDVRSGKMTFDDLSGMILTFTYGDQLGVQFYGEAILAAKDEALAEVEKAGCQTEAQKLLVLNEWLAHHTIFDMGYIMNLTAKEGEEPPMVAEEPLPPEHYEDVYNAVYEMYEKQISDTFRAQITAGLEAELRQQFYEGAIRNIVFENAKQEAMKQEGVTEEQAEAAANEQADKFMQDNDAAIKENAPAFVEQSFGADAAKQIAEQADTFIADAHENGLAMDPEHPDQKVPFEAIVDQQMETAKPEELGGMTPNEAIPVFADQAATGIADGVINYWEGSHIGCLGQGKAVCLGYSKAYAFLVQWLHPELYGKQGAQSDLSKAENWKTPEELYYNEAGELDPDAPYMVDLVRITFNAPIVMFGKRQDDFNSDHFWNAVKLDGKWYYVDPCYNDTYTEVMGRNRAETNGSMTHMYFLFSHTSTEKMYHGYYDIIRSLYKDLAVHQDYEDTWFARSSSNIYSDGEYFYYSYDSTDLFDMLDQQSHNGSNPDKSRAKKLSDRDVKLVRHKIGATDDPDVADTDFEALIEFNYKPDDSGKTYARVYNPQTRRMEKNQLMTDAYAKHMSEAAEYPLLCFTSAYYNGKVYFNLANCIYTYDPADGHIALVREYNTIHVARDKHNAFGGMALTTTTEENAVMTLENHPIAGMAIREDGKLYVSIATRLGFISGKDPHDFADQSSFGYEFEESNFNPKYNNYQRNPTEEQLQQMEMMGMARQYNDNDEFMWAANVEDVVDMAHFAGSEHTFEEIHVDATCGRNAYTERRCTECGLIEEGSRVEEEGTALDHHYLHYNETYYTRQNPDDENSAWRTGDCYVCTECGKAVNNPEKPKKGIAQTDGEYEKALRDWQAEVDEYNRASQIAGHSYGAAEDPVWAEDYSSVTFTKLTCSGPCAERRGLMDLLLEDDTLVKPLQQPVTLEAEATETGKDEQGEFTVYTAEGDAEGYTVTVTVKVYTETEPEPTEPETEPTEPETEPTKPETEPTEPETKPTEPETQPTEPETQPTEPETEPTEPETEPTKPETEPTEPETKPTEPETQPTEPETEPTEPKPIQNPFTDVKKDDYYYDAVLWAVGNGITSGMTENKFGPDVKCTRGHAVTFLWNAEQKPAPENQKLTFTDIKADDYYRDPVLWAVEKNVTAGVEQTKFGPDVTCTRGQIVTFLWKAAGSPISTLTKNPFTDVHRSDYYYDAVLWAVENGITTGTSDSTFSPEASCTRGQIVTFLYHAYTEN